MQEELENIRHEIEGKLRILQGELAFEKAENKRWETVTEELEATIKQLRAELLNYRYLMKNGCTATVCVESETEIAEGNWKRYSMD